MACHGVTRGILATMDREQGRRDITIPPEVAQALTDRLHQLSVPEAERVLERAIAIQSESDLASLETIDTDMLGRIAAELSVDPAHLRQALAEELLRLDNEEPGWLDRLLGPQGVAAQAIITDDPARVRAAIDNWLGTHEGLRKRSESVSGTRWERDPALLTTARMKLGMAQGAGMLRGVDGVTTSVRPATDTQQLVKIEADTGKLRRRGIQLLALAALVGGVVTATGAAADGFGLSDLAAGAIVAAMTGGGVLLGIRMWVNRVKESVGRAVDAFANPDLIDYPGGVVGLLGRFLGGRIWTRSR